MCVYAEGVFEYLVRTPVRAPLNLDTESGGLGAGGLGGGGGLRGRFKQRFQDGLGVHFGRGLGGSRAAAGAGQGGRETVFSPPTSAARGVAEAPEREGKGSL